MSEQPNESSNNFIQQIIANDFENGVVEKIVTRFPPEPGGFLHIGHAKSLCLNFGLAQKFPGVCNLRMDDTNPSKEDSAYTTAIIRDVEWLGFTWDGEVRHTSDYYQQLYDWAILLINKGLAYVDSQSAETIRETRGTLTEPGIPSPDRDRSIEENLDLFTRMRAGEFPDGSYVLRAKIDMAAANINMRDPLMYRIAHIPHDRTGNDWPIYPLYDYAHGLSDAIEGITHSICTLEFEDHRPLYDWYIEQVNPEHHPHQYEFARLNLAYTLMSKRWLNNLVKAGHVNGWDDPRMPTLAGMRRRGYPPEAIREFCARIGVTKQYTTIEMEKLEGAVREVMDAQSIRAFGITKPLKVTITNYNDHEVFTAKKHPKEDWGEREIDFSSTLWIERDDFAENPEPGFKRLTLGGEAKLRYSYIIKCDEIIRDEHGGIAELKATIDPDRSRKFKGLGIIHWLSAAHAKPAQFNLYERLFTIENPNPDNFESAINPQSLQQHQGYVEAGIETIAPEKPIQFERVGFFVADPDRTTDDHPIFNQTVSLKDNWKK